MTLRTQVVEAMAQAIWQDDAESDRRPWNDYTSTAAAALDAALDVLEPGADGSVRFLIPVLRGAVTL